ncbi:hypothetical protein [Microbacterium suwonense]|uniref:hypothetical protein n=1 Tax=Microbacterium suwonense TaxID=683047 RepID=UPI00257484AE|nr:hypothetical protein [Microbacterium suwonense]
MHDDEVLAIEDQRVEAGQREQLAQSACDVDGGVGQGRPSPSCSRMSAKYISLSVVPVSCATLSGRAGCAACRAV